MKIEGTDTALVVDFGYAGRDRRALRCRAQAALRLRRARQGADRRGASVEAVGRTEAPPRRSRPAAAHQAAPQAIERGGCTTARCETPVFDRAKIAPAPRSTAPRSSSSQATTIVEPGWRAAATAGQLVLKRVVTLDRGKAVGTKVDPVMLEVFNNLFMSIAEQMGSTLENTSYSVNIKERLDFSCAVFDRGASSSPTRRTCRCIWARWAKREDRHPRNRDGGKIHPRATSTCSTRPTMAARICPTSRSSRPCSARSRRRQQGHSVLRRQPRPPRRHRRHHARLDAARQPQVGEEGVLFDNFCWSTRANSARRRCATLLAAATIRRAIPTRTSPT